MTYWFLGFLALIWIAYFVPGAVRARRRTPLPAAARFKRAMGFIAPPRPAPRHAPPRRRRQEMVRTSSGRWIVVPHGTERHGPRDAALRLQSRRRRVLAALGSIALLTAGVAIARGGSWLEMHLVADGILVFYVAMLYETKRRQAERSEKVRTIVLPEDHAAREQEARVFEPLRAGGGHS